MMRVEAVEAISEIAVGEGGKRKGGGGRGREGEGRWRSKEEGRRREGE